MSMTYLEVLSLNQLLQLNCHNPLKLNPLGQKAEYLLQTLQEGRVRGLQMRLGIRARVRVVYMNPTPFYYSYKFQSGSLTMATLFT